MATLTQTDQTPKFFIIMEKFHLILPNVFENVNMIKCIRHRAIFKCEEIHYSELDENTDIIVVKQPSEDLLTYFKLLGIAAIPEINTGFIFQCNKVFENAARA